jgi:hypothetical protein
LGALCSAEVSAIMRGSNLQYVEFLDDTILNSSAGAPLAQRGWPSKTAALAILPTRESGRLPRRIVPMSSGLCIA